MPPRYWSHDTTEQPGARLCHHDAHGCPFGESHRRQNGLLERACGPWNFMKNPDGWADPLARPRGVGLRPAMPAFLRASAGREDAARNGGMASRRLAPQTRTDACAGFSTLRWQATKSDGLPHLSICSLDTTLAVANDPTFGLATTAPIYLVLGCAMSEYDKELSQIVAELNRAAPSQKGGAQRVAQST